MQLCLDKGWGATVVALVALVLPLGVFGICKKAMPDCLARFARSIPRPSILFFRFFILYRRALGVRPALRCCPRLLSAVGSVRTVLRR